MHSSSAPSDILLSDGETPSDVTASNFLWPEARRACCLCKLNKIRCEGGRPCTACARKGLAPEKCIVGCRGCRHARLMCDGERPCLNCRINNLDCDYIVIENSHISPVTSLPAYANREDGLPAGERREPQSLGGRTKVACFACRRDNKKCEDQRPCGRCILKKEECISLQRTQTIVKKRCLPCRMYNRKCEDQRPCAHCLEEGEVCVDMERKGTGPGSRVKKACTNCKRLKVQCDDDWPCKSCSRRKLTCDSQRHWGNSDSTAAENDMYTSDGLDVLHHDHSPIVGPSSLHTSQEESQFNPQALGYGPNAYMIFPAPPPTFVDGAVSSSDLNPNYNAPSRAPQADTHSQMHGSRCENAPAMSTIDTFTQPSDDDSVQVHMQFESDLSIYPSSPFGQSVPHEYEHDLNIF